MNKNFHAKRFGFIFLLLLLIFLAGCSSNTSFTTYKTNSVSPENTIENCEAFAGKWSSHVFNNVWDEDKIICGDAPCGKGKRDRTGLILTCSDGKISGEAVLLFISPHIHETNIAGKPPEITEPEKHLTAPFKEIRIENGALHLSYFFDKNNKCLKEISISPKGRFLLGKFQSVVCREPSAPRLAEKGSVLFTR